MKPFLLSNPFTSVEISSVVANNYDASEGEAITGRLTWKNNNITQGASIWAIFLLGKNEELYGFPVEDKTYLIGSLQNYTAPALGAQRTDNIPSRAAFAYDSGSWDGLAIIGALENPQQVGIYMWNERIIGIEYNSFIANLTSLGGKWFLNVLKVVAAAAPAEMISLAFISG